MYFQKPKRVGVAPLLIVVTLVIVVAVAGVGVYYLTLTPGSSGPTHTTTLTVGHTTPSGVHTYNGNYNFTVPLGPGGERVYSNNTVQTYGSVQLASGSFTFSINPLNYTGTGRGSGIMVVTTTGFCSGKVTVPYTFFIQATHPPGQNISVFFLNPTPGSAFVPLHCTGSTSGVNTATNNPISFLPEYPGLLTTATMPVTVSRNWGSGTTSYVSITQTS
ncbi:MAG TPA: hypothetical protein VGR56_07850 [Nitrososphaerales archaeon]|nr:hypothetical protein [Nitrososphaerales archaeon]